jgi:AAA15 family ATPase/GTPase
MIHYLKIRNFGPIKDEVEMSFEAAEESTDNVYEVEMSDKTRLLKLAYIYGANASGKTTVLKAFDFLRQLLLKPINDKGLELEYDPFLFCESPYARESKIELSFYVEGTRYIYEVIFNKLAVIFEKVAFYQTAKPTELFSRTTDLEKRLTKIEFGSRIKTPARERDLLEANTLHNNSVIGAYTKTNVDIPELEKLNKWFGNYFLGMITANDNLSEITASYLEKNPAASKWINLYMHKADPQLSEVKIGDNNEFISAPLAENFYLSQGSYRIKTELKPLKENPKFHGGGSIHRKIDFVHKLNDKSYQLSFLKESNGTKRFFGLGAPLYVLIHNSHFLLIDELETSLHSDLMIFFMQVFLLNSKESQMIVTTHNISLMENLDFLRRDALWFSEKESDGSVSLYSATDFDSSTLRKDSNILRAYRTGKLGAKPNLGSPYVIEE